ncbi:hypothetical protein PBY51_010050 [Eleginops maclovinus]|uniref:Uncharacterized protein n=1 Tax=Eleginops maclovinus TaxID=56733 RepID=A0AAN7XV97_ELEMC|nr:hypothetical protein PBY51_010050 [Eleginops maclovinus]
MTGCNLPRVVLRFSRASRRSLAAVPFHVLSQLQAVSDGYTQALGSVDRAELQCQRAGNAALRHTWDQSGLWSLLRRHRPTTLTSLFHNRPILTACTVHPVSFSTEDM